MYVNLYGLIYVEMYNTFIINKYIDKETILTNMTKTTELYDNIIEYHSYNLLIITMLIIHHTIY